MDKGRPFVLGDWGLRMKRLVLGGWWLGLLFVVAGCGTDRRWSGRQPGRPGARKTQGGEAIDREGPAGPVCAAHTSGRPHAPLRPRDSRATGARRSQHHRCRHRGGSAVGRRSGHSSKGTACATASASGRGVVPALRRLRAASQLLIDSNWQVVRIYRGTVSGRAWKRDIQSAPRKT